MRDLVHQLPGSLIREIANGAMHRPDVLALWFGESDLPTDPLIRAAAVESLGQGETFYAPNLGIAPLRAAIAAYQNAQHGGASRAENIVVTVSGLNALLVALSAVIDPGDDVITLTPGWPNIAAIPALLGASVTLAELRLEHGRFALDLDALIAAIGPRTRAVLLNSPHNPTGWQMPADQVRRLADELDRRGIWLIADEVYGRMVHEGDHASFLPLFDDARRIIVVNSFSKTWAMTGWRLGWLTIPAALGDQFAKLMEFNTSCAPVFVQRAGLAAIAQGEPFVARQSVRLKAARAAVQQALGQHPRIELPAMDATFYTFPRIAGLVDGAAFARRAIEEIGVGLAPGEAFGEAGRGHIRLCYARDPDVVATACRRLADMLDTTG